MTSVMLAAGDASGDAYAADFARVLRLRLPDARLFGLGGDEMVAAGVDLVEHQRALAVGGIVELLPDLYGIVRTWFRVGAALERSRPDLLVLVDSAGFNIPFARRARSSGIPILYYVCPQVWAWRRHRIRKIARRVDRLAAIFPFEPAFYEGSGARVEFVGNPLVDRMRNLSQGRTRESARSVLGIPDEAPIVALLPGSRRDELRHCLAVHLEAAREIHARNPKVRFVLPVAPSLERSRVDAMLREATPSFELPLTVQSGGALDALLACDVALVKPGTCTLEAALLGRPLVVAARAARSTAAIVRRLVHVDSLAMPNLICGRKIVPEFLQEEAVPGNIAEAVLGLLKGPARDRQMDALLTVREALGNGGAAERAAEIAEEMIAARRQS